MPAAGELCCIFERAATDSYVISRYFLILGFHQSSSLLSDSLSLYNIIIILFSINYFSVIMRDDDNNYTAEAITEELLEFCQCEALL